MAKSRRDESIKVAFGKRVRELRTEKGLSQEGLALVCDLDRTYIGGIVSTSAEQDARYYRHLAMILPSRSQLIRDSSLTKTDLLEIAT